MNTMNEQQNNLTVATGKPAEARFLRLPKTGQRDPVFSLSRSFLNTLVLACRQNGYTPPVRSIVVRAPGGPGGGGRGGGEYVGTPTNPTVEGANNHATRVW